MAGEPCCNLRSVMLERMAGGPWMAADRCPSCAAFVARAWSRLRWYPLQEDRRDESSLVLFGTGIGCGRRWRVERMSEDPERWEVEIRRGPAGWVFVGAVLERVLADAMSALEGS